MVTIVKSAAEVKQIVSLDRSAFNKETGEIIEVRPDVPFRSITDLKAFSDAEKSDKPSMTDPSQYEPLESILQRCQRGELVFDASKGWYEFDGNDVQNVDDILDREEPEDDLTFIDDQAEAIFKASQESLKKSGTPPTPAPLDPIPESSEEPEA